MNGLAQAVALISAVVYIAAAPLELFFFGNPRVRAFLHVEADNVADVRCGHSASASATCSPASARSSDWSSCGPAMSQCEGRLWLVDPECPWWAKLRRAESLIDEVRLASRRSTEQGVAGRLFGRR